MEKTREQGGRVVVRENERDGERKREKENEKERRTG